jgi:hypothetical protein
MNLTTLLRNFVRQVRLRQKATSSDRSDYAEKRLRQIGPTTSDNDFVGQVLTTPKSGFVRQAVLNLEKKNSYSLFT